MDRFFDRLGEVIKSFLDDEDERVFRPGRSRESSFGDPDLDEAYEELDEFLRSSKSSSSQSRTDDSFSGRNRGGQDSSKRGGFGEQRSGSASTKPSGVPELLRNDFAELGVAFGASADVCKAAYKKLLKIHHPDRHAGHPGNMKKATEKSARINASYQRIEKWRETGRAE